MGILSQGRRGGNEGRVAWRGGGRVEWPPGARKTTLTADRESR